jgi:hypothetical protein
VGSRNMSANSIKSFSISGGRCADVASVSACNRLSSIQYPETEVLGNFPAAVNSVLEGHERYCDQGTLSLLSHL